LTLLGKLDPVMLFLSSHIRLTCEDTIKWMLMELTSNAIFAAAGYLLGRRTGLSRKDMLEAIGTSTVWPDLSRRKTPLSSFEPVYSIEKAFGLSVLAAVIISVLTGVIDKITGRKK